MHNDVMIGESGHYVECRNDYSHPTNTQCKYHNHENSSGCWNVANKFGWHTHYCD